MGYRSEGGLMQVLKMVLTKSYSVHVRCSTKNRYYTRKKVKVRFMNF